MTRIRTGLAVTLLAACALAAAAAPAQASVKHCKPGRYGLILPSSPLAVDQLRAINLPRRTDGYAPRCLVAEAAAADIENGFAHGKLPSRLHLYGARWNGGRWRCVYHNRNGGGEDPLYEITCHHSRKPSRRIHMRMGD